MRVAPDPLPTAVWGSCPVQRQLSTSHALTLVMETDLLGPGNLDAT